MILPTDFPLVVGTGVLMCWQVWAFGAQVGQKRHQIFNEDYMRKQWGTLHKNQIGDDITAGGFPDTGNGLYSHRLSYKDWYKFNVLQRVHLNSFEQIALAETSLLAAGLYRPKEAAVIGLVYVLGRLLYSVGAKSHKAGKARGFGFILSFLSVVANSGIFAYYLFKHIKGMK